MANPPPVVSLAVPVLGWYQVTFGSLQVSQILSIPNAASIASPDGLNPGLVGVSDGAMAHLAGIIRTGDSGSNWLMWEALSTAVPDGLTIFSPYPVGSLLAGRWFAQIPTAVGLSRIITAGAVVQLAPNTVFCAVRKVPPSTTTIILPPMATAILGKTITIKVDNNAPNFPTSITADSLFDGILSSDTLNQAQQSRDYTPDGFQWNRG